MQVFTFMIKTIRTSPANSDFTEMVKQLDAELAITDGEEHAFYDQFNKTDSIQHVVVAYENEKAVACGALKQYESRVMEVKRMFTEPRARGKGYAGKVLAELETWARELGNVKCILETGVRQPHAIATYKKNGYRLMPNYGQYAKAENSLCFCKDLTDEKNKNYVSKDQDL